MRNTTITGTTVRFFRGNQHRKFIPVWLQEYSTPDKAKRAAKDWKNKAKIRSERITKH